jgi:hypothetical protein
MAQEGYFKASYSTNLLYCSTRGLLLEGNRESYNEVTLINKFLAQT